MMSLQSGLPVFPDVIGIGGLGFRFCAFLWFWVCFLNAVIALFRGLV